MKEKLLKTPQGAESIFLDEAYKHEKINEVINDIYTKNSLARRTGIGSDSFVIRAQFGDPVHNIFGGNFISNPLSLPFSAIRIPHLFSNDATLSPHTVPCIGGRTAYC